MMAPLVFTVLMQTIVFTNVVQGQSSSVHEARKVVVRTAEEWQSTWKNHSTAPVPKVDFSQSIVVGVFLGMRPTAGYSVAILAVRRTRNSAVVEYIVGEPDRNQIVAQMLTAPFHLVAIPRDVQKIEFKQVGGR